MTAMHLWFRYRLLRIRKRPLQLIPWIVLAVAFILAIRHYWMRLSPMHGVTLLKVAGYVVIPSILAVAGNHFASEVIKERKKRWMWRIVFIGLGLAGVLIVSVVEKKIDDEHAGEVGTLTSTLDTVQKGNTAILQHLTNPMLNAQEREVSRRQDILVALRHEWILSHDNISAALLAGVEQPPADWVNKRLKQLGEVWTVESREERQARPTQPEIAQAPYGNLAARCDELGNKIMFAAEQRNRARPNPATHREEYKEWYKQNDGMFRAFLYPQVVNLHRDLAANNFKDTRLDELIEEYERYFRSRQNDIQAAISFPESFYLSIDEIREIGERLRVLATQFPR